jgi:hypothetical protein
MKALLEKYLLRSIPREGGGEGGAAAPEKAADGSLVTVVPKTPTFDLSSIGADMNDHPDQVKGFVIADEEPVKERAAGVQENEIGVESADDIGKGKQDEGGDDDAAAKAKAEADAKAKATPEKKDGEDGGEMPAWVKRRLERQQRKHDREVAELRAKVEKPAPAADTATDPGPAPVASDFADFEEYMTAKAEHEAKVTAAKKGKPPEKKVEAEPKGKEAEGKADEEVISARETLEDAIADKHPELWAKLTSNETKAITREMVLTVADLDNPAGVFQALLADDALRIKIAEMPPLKQAAALAKLDKPAIEEKKGDGKKPAAGDPPPKRSEAPPPIKPVNGKAEVDAGYETGDFATFEAKRKEEETRRGVSGDLWL